MLQGEKYRHVSIAHLTLPVKKTCFTPGTSGPEEKSIVDLTAKAVKMPIIHLKFRLGQQQILPISPLLPPALPNSLNMDLELSHTLIKPYCYVSKVGLKATSLTGNVGKEIHGVIKMYR